MLGNEDTLSQWEGAISVTTAVLFIVQNQMSITYSRQFVKRRESHELTAFHKSVGGHVQPNIMVILHEKNSLRFI